jgi:hypothetical protein
MAKTIKPDDLGKAISEELGLYHKDVLERVNLAGEEAAESLLKKTKSTAPKKSGAYRRSLAIKTETNTASGDKRFIWGAKAPHSGLTHLLVHGHAETNGGRVEGDPFLENALAEVIPTYEKSVEEAVKNDS